MAKSMLVGCERERELLETMLESGQAELLALYGRRRIGKTHLIRSFVEPRAGMCIEVTGTKDGPANLQRRRFREALELGDRDWGTHRGYGMT